jgi:anti-sigma factor RsiW
MKKIHRNLQAYVDGELSESDRLRFESQMKEDPKLSAEVRELQSVAKALQEEHLSGLKTSEAMWQDVQRELRLQKQAPAGNAVLLKRGMWGSLAAAALITLMVWHPLADTGATSARIEFVDAHVPDAVPVVYTEPSSGWTVVWLSNAHLESTHETL